MMMSRICLSSVLNGIVSEVIASLLLFASNRVDRGGLSGSILTRSVSEAQFESSLTLRVSVANLVHCYLDFSGNFRRCRFEYGRDQYESKMIVANGPRSGQNKA